MTLPFNTIVPALPLRIICGAQRKWALAGSGEHTQWSSVVTEETSDGDLGEGEIQQGKECNVFWMGFQDKAHRVFHELDCRIGNR